MMGRTHMAFGAGAGLLVAPLFGASIVPFVALSTFASLLPDVDHENSKINRVLPITRWIPVLFKHRGFFHSIFPPLMLYAFFWALNLQTLGLPLMVGYLAHLGSDCLTRLGCNLLHPFSTFRIQGPVLTDGLMEYILFGCVMVANGALVLSSIGMFG